MMNELFSERVRRLRQARNLTQAALAALCGLSPRAVSDWEIGRSRPWNADMPAIARALHVTLDYLHTGREAPAHAALIAAIRRGEGRDVLMAMVNRHD